MSIRTVISSNKKIAGASAARQGTILIRQAISERGEATIVVATGASQFEMLQTLVGEDLPWNKITIFHLDEYVGLPVTHPASFRQYLWERFHRLLPLAPNQFHYVNGEADPAEECERLGNLIARHPVDVCFAGIGENGHLAFNDPPANFETTEPYLVVNLDEACRKQQFGEGWFPSLEAVPRQAVSMSIRQFLKSQSIILTVPDARKAEAVRNTLEGPIDPKVPASILQTHLRTTLFLDPPAASLLK